MSGYVERERNLLLRHADRTVLLHVLGVRSTDDVSQRRLDAHLGYRDHHARAHHPRRARHRGPQGDLRSLLHDQRGPRGGRHGGIRAARRAGAGGRDHDDRRGEAPIASLEQLVRGTAHVPQRRRVRAEPVGRRAADVPVPNLWASRASVSELWCAAVFDARLSSANVFDSRQLPGAASAGTNVPAGAVAAQRVWSRIPDGHVCAALSFGAGATLPDAISDVRHTAATLLKRYYSWNFQISSRLIHKMLYLDSVFFLYFST